MDVIHVNCSDKLYILTSTSLLINNNKLIELYNIDGDLSLPYKSYILEFFENKKDLFFMFTLKKEDFIEVYYFLDYLEYDETDEEFINQFITYVVNNKLKLKWTCFMNNHIRCINNYLNNGNSGYIDINTLINTCTLQFYKLYLTNWNNEEDELICNECIIKYNKIDIYNYDNDKIKYYKYVHKYDNALTSNIKVSTEYNTYIMQLSKELIKACDIGDFNEIKKRVEYGANINYSHKEYQAPIFSLFTYYCKCNTFTFEILDYLIDNGADLNIIMYDDYNIKMSLLYVIVFLLDEYKYENNIIKIITYIMKIDSSKTKPAYVDNKTLYEIYKLIDNINILKLFIPSSKEEQAELFLYSCQNNGIKVIKYFIEELNIDINVCGFNGDNALFSVLNYREEESEFHHELYNKLDYLLSFKEPSININHQNDDGTNLISFICQYHAPLHIVSLRCIQLLIKYNIDINMVDNDDTNALLYLCKHEYGEINMFKYLVKYGATFPEYTQKNKDNWKLKTYFHWYIREYIDKHIHEYPDYINYEDDLTNIYYQQILMNNYGDTDDYDLIDFEEAYYKYNIDDEEHLSDLDDEVYIKNDK